MSNPHLYLEQGRRARFTIGMLVFVLLSACGTAPQSAAPPELAGLATEAVQGSDGVVVIRAEGFQAHIPRGKHSWHIQQDPGSPTGSSVVALPDLQAGADKNLNATSPRLDYRIKFVKSGTHYLWVFGQAPAQSPLKGDSLHLGLNGQMLESARRVGDLKVSYGWINSKMAGGPATLKIAKPGTYTLNVWMREDGARFSALALSNSAAFRPDHTTVQKLTPVPTPAPVPSPTPAPTPGTDLPQSDISPITARAADAFIDSVGVNTHFHYTDTVWGYKYNEIIKPKLLASGIRHVRDGVYTYAAASRNSFYYSRLRELGAAGIRFNLSTGMDTAFGEMTNFALLDDIYSWTDGAVVSYEGVNEPDIQGVSDWVTQTRTVQQSLYDTVKSTPALHNVAVIGPSPVWEPDTLGKLSQLMDYGNSHAYSGGATPMTTGYGSLAYNLDKAAKVSGQDPVMVTEVGYHNAVSTSDGHIPTSEAASGTYIPRLLLSFFNQGVTRTYLYEFIDTWSDPSRTHPDSNFGLLRNNGTEKPAYVAVKTLLNLLKDPGGAFTPGSLRLKLTGSTQNVQQTLLQKRDGTFYLALWVEEESWDRNARRDRFVPSRVVRVQLGDPVGNITRYAFRNDGNAPASALSLTNGELELTLDDKLTLIELGAPVR